MTVKQLIETLTKQGYSLEGLADKLEISYMTLYRWARGKGKPHSLFVKEMNRLIQEKTNQTND